MSKTQKDFNDWARGHLNMIMTTLELKGEQYAPGESYALQNFLQSAEMFGTTEQYEIMQFATKHWIFMTDAVKTTPFVRDFTNFPYRKMEESARDVIVYMLLLIYSLLSDEGGD